MSECCTDGERHFRFWCHKVLPTVYDDSLSYWEVVCKLVNHINNMATEVNRSGEGIEELQQALDELKKEVEKFKQEGWEDEYMPLVEKWLNDNMWCIMSWASRTVWFGLSDDGYFEAFVPDNYNFLDFDVIQDPESEHYGKLVLSYCQEVYEPCEISCWDADCPKPPVYLGQYETACAGGE